MAFTRDLGIQYPSDATQISPSSTLTARKGWRYITRGTRYGANLGKLSGFEYPLGITFFRNLMPKSNVGLPEHVEYARFIDVRKTKIIDTVKESIFGTTFRSGLDHQLTVQSKDELQQEAAISRLVFHAKVTGNHISNNIWYHTWHQVEWDTNSREWIFKDGGLNSNNSTNNQKEAIHAPSGGVWGLSASEIVVMSVTIQARGSWRASFMGGSQGIWMGQITSSIPNGNFPLYDAEALPTTQYPEITVSSTAPINRLIGVVRYFPAATADPCIFIRTATDSTLSLIVLTETIDTIECPDPLGFPAPLDDPGARLNRAIFVHNPTAVGAIGQAL